MATLVGFCMELLRIILTFTRPLSDKVLDFLYGLVMGQTKMLPPIDDKLLLLPATELASRIRNRKLKAETVMLTYIKRIKEVEPLVNACTDQRLEDAMKEAVEVDRLLQKTSKSEEQIERETPLLGVPFTCKESVGVKGLAMTKGVVCYQDHKASADGQCVEYLRKAGAIPVTVTNVPVLCMWWESANHIFGMTRNPYDNRRTVGGSSGGEGAIITAGGALFGIGTDLAGSIRIPASFCGIYGHKPSRGIIPNSPPWPPRDGGGSIGQYVSTGPMCRYARDLTLLTDIMSGGLLQRLDPKQKVDFHQVRVYYMEKFPGCLLNATPDVKTAVRQAARYFEEKFGIEAVELKVEELKDAFTIWESKLLETGAQSFKTMISDGEELNLGVEFIKSLFQCSDYTWPALYFAAVDRREKDDTYYRCLEKFEILQEKFQNVFKEDAILLLPTHPEPPPHYLLTIPKYPNIAYTCIFNILGYPSTQIPAGLSNELPIGIQAVSSTHKDHLTLAAAVELDNLFRGWRSPCLISA